MHSANEVASPQHLDVPLSIRLSRPLGAVLVSCLYLGLVLLLWLPFGTRNGMPYETLFAYTSETTSFWHGFFYSDPLRPYTSIFYNLGYHLSIVLGRGGSFVGFQLVYAFLWWGRGVLAFLIVDALFPRRRLLSALVGVLVIVHASDHATNWVGQMNQYGMIFWTLLSIYLLVLAFKATGAAATVALTVGAMVATRLALWSYESPLFVIFLVPVLLVVLRFGRSRRSLGIAAAYLVFPLIYAWDNIERYRSGQSTYQESVTRKHPVSWQLFSDLWFNVKNSLEFWDWGSWFPAVSDPSARTWVAYGGGACAAAAILVAVVSGSRRQDDDLPGWRPLLVLLGCGIAVLVASFPAYLILTSSRLLWRTQFLSALGAGLVLASLIALVARAAPRRSVRVACVAAATAVIAYYVVAAAYSAASFHHSGWTRHRQAIAEVLGVAPRVRPGTLIVLTGVPKAADPFGDNMWFDLAMRLAYPHVPVTGVYFFGDGTPAPDEGMALRGRTWVYDGTGFPTVLRRVPVANTLVVRYSSSGLGTLVRRLPRYLRRPALVSAYAPYERIDPEPLPAFVEDRYGPIP